MKLNGIRKIDNNGGDYLVLTDYGQEGIAVSHQCETADEAAQWMLSSGCSSPHAVVKVVHASVSQVVDGPVLDCSPLVPLCREFLRILDIQEESDGGCSFHPTTIQSCRVMDMAKMNSVLKDMRRHLENVKRADAPETKP